MKGDVGFFMYTNAEEILPHNLIKQIQGYIQGQEIYIPKCDEKKLGWGERNGAKAQIRERNHTICRRYLNGASIEELMAEFHLSYDSIRKIVRGNRKRQLGINKGT